MTGQGPILQSRTMRKEVERQIRYQAKLLLQRGGRTEAA